MQFPPMTSMKRARNNIITTRKPKRGRKLARFAYPLRAGAYLGRTNKDNEGRQASTRPCSVYREQTSREETEAVQAEGT